jgi:hypothetical protein
MAGRYRDPNTGKGYAFRYADAGLNYDPSKEMILNDGRKTIGGTPAGISNNGINNHGDVGLWQVAIHTAENVYFKISDRIYPGYTLPSGSLSLIGIAERNADGLPPAIMTAWQGSTEDGKLIKYGYYLLPEAVSP